MAVDDSDPLSDLPERAIYKIQDYFSDGLDAPEVIQDLSVLLNMYKSRFTNILPVNFRH